MSIFPTTRIGRALVVSAVVVGAAKIVPFLLQVFSLTGDELTELPPLTPAGTDTTFLLANPVAWFLAVAAGVYLVLLLRDVVVHLVSPPPPARRPRARTSTARSAAARPPAARKPAPTKTAARKPAAKKPAAKRTPAKSTARTPAKKPTRRPAPARATTTGTRTASRR